MKRRVGTAVAALALAVISAGTSAQGTSCIPVAHAPVPLQAEVAYSQARRVLLDAGWQPLQSVRWQDVETVLDSDAKIRWREGQKEVQGCVMSSAECRFLFKDIYNNRLRVDTFGEGRHAQVTGFEFVCPD